MTEYTGYNINTYIPIIVYIVGIIASYVKLNSKVEVTSKAVQDLQKKYEVARTETAQLAKDTATLAKELNKTIDCKIDKLAVELAITNRQMIKIGNQIARLNGSLQTRFSLTTYTQKQIKEKENK